MIRLFFLVVLLVSTNISWAQESPSLIRIIKPPAFALPIDCRLDVDCWVMNYVDMVPDDNLQTDPACLARTYDSHKGTDFAVLDGKSMENGVNVLAALDGKISKIRDGEPDRWPTEADLKQVQEQRKECGNAVLIDHKDGYQTLYCHLKNNSITVKVGDAVSAGDIIAQVGLSGYTQFPHVHFGILKDNKIVDPFTGQENTESCQTFKASLWQNNLDVEYQPLIIQASGFSNQIPSLDAIEKEAQSPAEIPLNSKVLSVWVTIFGARIGDKIILEIRDPNNKVFVRRLIEQDKTKARQFYYTGRELGRVILTEGAYTATIKVTRIKNDGTPQEWSKITSVLVRS